MMDIQIIGQSIIAEICNEMNEIADLVEQAQHIECYIPVAANPADPINGSYGGFIRDGADTYTLEAEWYALKRAAEIVARQCNIKICWGKEVSNEEPNEDSASGGGR